MILAITGGTGFVGSHLIDHALELGHQVRALARKPQVTRAGVTWIEGALDRPLSLKRLVEGADAVIHVAGVVNGSRAAFVAGNVEGTKAMIAATQAAGIRRFVAVSSLAAREPKLSTYGWSKNEADAYIRASGFDWTIVRPPAIFGPRDHDMLELFRMARRRVAPMPPAGGRMSALYVEDLTTLLLTLATTDSLVGWTVEPDDGTPNGWDHRDFMRAIGTAMGTPVSPLPLPRPALEVVSLVDRTLRRGKARLTRDRVRYFCHPDWVSHAPPPAAVWTPSVPTPQALAQTVAWYRAAGLL